MADKEEKKKIPEPTETDKKNLLFWDSVSITDSNYTKDFKGKGGFNGTAIAAHYQIKNATAKFGVVGFDDTWGVIDEKFELLVPLPADEHHNIVTYQATLYYHLSGKRGSMTLDAEIPCFNWNNSSSTWFANNDMRKKVKTDALTKGLSHLGFNADVFMNDFSDNGNTGDKGGGGGNSGGGGGGGNRAKIDRWFPDDLYQVLMKEGTPDGIQKAIDDYSVKGSGIKGDYKTALLKKKKDRENA